MGAGHAIERVAIIGAGSTGTVSGEMLSILFSAAGFTVTLEDVLPGKLRRAAAEIALAPRNVDVRYASSIEDAVRDADLILDTVPDELESKLEIFSLLDRMAPPGALFATPTQVLSIADLASCTYRAELCFGLKFSGPSAEGSLRIEASYAPPCEQETRERLRTCLLRLGATVTFNKDTQILP